MRTIVDKSCDQGRMPASVMLGDTLEAKGQTRTFFTDASGQVVNATTGLKKTSWAVVETGWEESQSKDTPKITKVKEWGGKEQGMPSVSRSEAFAVKEVVEELSEGQTGHIHTDSKARCMQYLL